MAADGTYNTACHLNTERVFAATRQIGIWVLPAME